MARAATVAQFNAIVFYLCLLSFQTVLETLLTPITRPAEYFESEERFSNITDRNELMMPTVTTPFVKTDYFLAETLSTSVSCSHLFNDWI